MKNARLRSIEAAKRRLRDGQVFYTPRGSELFYQRGQDNPYRVVSVKDGANRSIRGLWDSVDTWLSKEPHRFI